MKKSKMFGEAPMGMMGELGTVQKEEKKKAIKPMKMKVPKKMSAPKSTSPKAPKAMTIPKPKKRGF